MTQRLLFLLMLCFSGLFTSCNSSKVESSEWTNLLDKDLSQWDIWLGVPHKSSGIAGYEDVEDVKGGTPLGLGNKKNVFSVIEEDKVLVLKITGEIFGSLASKEEFENYHLKFQVKWGEKKWEPRLDAKRNNGMLYHSIGAHGSGLWDTWMSSLEFEVEETNFGDFITINDANVKAKCPAVKKEDGKFYFDPSAPLQDFCWKQFESGRCFKSEDAEKAFGEWNLLELICYEDMAIHIVNGKVVNVVYQPRFFNGAQWIKMNKGKLQIQSEAAETYFKNIEIKNITGLEEGFQKYLRN